MKQNPYIDADMTMSAEEADLMARKYSFFTWVPQKFGGGLPVSSAEGCYMYGYDGRKYFDLSSCSVFTNIGHQNPKVLGAIKEQVDQFSTCASHQVSAARSALSKKIIEELCPDNMGKVLFTLAGADANEYALRLAKCYTGKTKIFSQYSSYHGSTYGATNLNGERMRGTPDPAIAGFVKFFGTNWQTHGLDFKTDEERGDFLYNMLRDQIIAEDPDTVAAIFFETITGSNGAYVPPANYYKKVRAMCDEFNIVMVCDEVMVGFGRTGKMFAFEHFGIKPDMITVAKGLTSGYIPMGATILNKDITEFFEEHEFPCGLTFTSHPVACAAALANIEVIEQENLVENAAKMGALLMEGLMRLKDTHACVKDVQGKGLMNGFSFKPEYLQDKTDGDQTTHGFLDLLEEKGYLTFTGRYGYVMVAPPLIITAEQVNDIINVLDECLTIFESRHKK